MAGTKPKEAPDDGLVAVTYPGPFDEVEMQVGYQWKVVKQGETIRVKPEEAMNRKQQGWKVPSIPVEEMVADLNAHGVGIHADHPDYDAYRASQEPVSQGGEA